MRTTKKPLLIALLAVLAVLAVPAGAQALTVYAAASLRDAFPKIDGAPTYSFLGSNQLQAQIERGAPADVFASASPNEAEALFRAGLCTRPVTFATNVVVLITPKGNPSQVRSVYSLRTGSRRLSVGTAGVPIGAYTRQILAAAAAHVDPAHEPGQPRSQCRRHHVEGRARLRRRGLRLRDRRQGGRRPRPTPCRCRSGRSRRSATGSASCAAPVSTPRPRTRSSRRSGRRTAAGSCRSYGFGLPPRG